MNRIISRRLLTWLLLAATLLLSYIVSWPLFLLTAVTIMGWAVARNLGPGLRPLQRIAPVGALVPLMLLALMAAQLGINRSWAFLITSAGFLTLLLFQVFTHRTRSITEVFPPAVLITGLVPLATLALAAVLWPGMAFAWVMIGDGYPEFHLMTLYRELPAGDFVPRHYPFATTGHLLVADSLNITSSHTGINAFRIDLQAMAAVTFLPIVLAVQQMQLAFGARLQSRRSLLQGMVLGIFACSGLVMGLPASNGFISTSSSILLYTSLAVLISSLFKRTTPSALIGSVLLIGVLLSTWQPVAMTGLGLFLAALSYRFFQSARMSPALVALYSGAGVLIVFGLYELFSLLARGTSGFPGLHGNFYYPMTPLAVFLLMGFIAITTATANRLRTTSIALSVAAITGSVAFLIGNRFFDFFDVLAGTFIVSSTPYYYLYKYIWLVSIPVVLLAGVAVTNRLTTNPRKSSTLLITTLFLVVPFLTVTNPNLPWIPKPSQPVTNALSDEFGIDLESKIPTLYFNVRSDLEDEAVSNWWLLQQRRYELAIGGTEWVEARQAFPLGFPTWRDIRTDLEFITKSDSVQCDETISITYGINVQDPVNLPTGVPKSCPDN